MTLALSGKPELLSFFPETSMNRPCRLIQQLIPHLHTPYRTLSTSPLVLTSSTEMPTIEKATRTKRARSPSTSSSRISSPDSSHANKSIKTGYEDWPAPRDAMKEASEFILECVRTKQHGQLNIFFCPFPTFLLFT
jgi:hypothetical protein